MKAFEAPRSKLHKVQRALGLAIGVSHLDTVLKLMQHQPNYVPVLPHDAILWPAFHSDGSLTIVRLTPNLGIERGRAEFGSDQIDVVVELLRSAPFEEVVRIVTTSLA